MAQRAVSVSTAPYDGHSLPDVLESLARCGATHVEPAFIVGYTEPFDESAFVPDEAERHRKAFEAAGLACCAMSSHIDLGEEGAEEVFAGRMRFARDIGAGIIITNAAVRQRAPAFERHIEPLLRMAESMGLVIALENPGDGRDNLMNVAADGVALVERFSSPHLRLNYDAANTASHRPEVDPALDAVRALPACAHMHLKDVARTEEGWFFRPLGEGDINMDIVFEGLRAYPDIPVSLELPLRLHRTPDARPQRAAAPVPITELEAAVARSLRLIAERL